MIRAFPPHKLMILALLLAVFMIVPLIESGLCAAEYQVSHASALMEDSAGAVQDEGQDASQQLNGSNGHCEHGHCHHLSPPLTSVSPPLDLIGASAHRPAVPNALFSRIPDTLIRPPKA
ncbi:MAG: hypothetical protein WCY07_12890 [Pigmentiphaga sp.]